MVQKTDSSSAFVAGGFFKALEGLPPGIWLELGALVNQLAEAQGADPEELSQIVRNLIANQPKNGPKNEAQIQRLVQLLPAVSSEKLPPEARALVEKRKEEIAQPLVKTVSSEKVEIKVESKPEPAKLEQGKLAQPQKAEVKQEMLVQEQMVKTVAKALYMLLLPKLVQVEQPIQREAKAPTEETVITAPKKGADAEFMSKTPHTTQLPPKTEEKRKEIHPTLNPIKQEGKTMENHTVNRNPPPKAETPLETKPALKVPSEIKQPLSEGSKASSSIPQQQPQVQNSDPKVLYAAPFTAEQAFESRRKEKKRKLPHEFEEEEEDESPEKKYPRN